MIHKGEFLRKEIEKLEKELKRNPPRDQKGRALRQALLKELHLTKASWGRPRA